MFITELAGFSDRSPQRIKNPSRADTERAIRALDGSISTMVASGMGQDVPHMIVGGGQEGKYVACVTLDNNEFYYLSNPISEARKMMLVVGGQEGDYDAKLIIGYSGRLCQDTDRTIFKLTRVSGSCLGQDPCQA